MATFSSSGVGSGMDVNSLVTQLVAAERATPEKRITQADVKLTTEFTSLARLKAAMSSFQTALTALKSKGTFDLRSVDVPEDAGFTATATGSAATANYQVEVRQLAKAAQLGSDPFTSGASSVVGTGKLTLSVGTKSFDVDIADGQKSLAGIRDAINASPDNTGVRATLITDVEGTRLVLTGTATGAENGIKVASSGGDGGLAAFDFDPNGVKKMAVVSPAQDAIVFVSNYEIRSASNVVNSAIDGVTLTLKKAEQGKSSSLAIQRDDAGIQTRMQSFVDAYNSLATQIASLRSYDASTGVAGPMLGDAMLRGIESQMRKILTTPVAAAGTKFSTLANIGITTGADGKLSLDKTELAAALTENPTAVTALMASENGVAMQASTFINSKLSSTGELAARETSIAAKRKDLTKQKDALDARMLVIQQRYMKQFNALDTMLAQMQSTSTYLTQQFASLANLNNQK